MTRYPYAMPIRSTHQSKYKEAEKDNGVQSNNERNTHVVREIKGYYGLILLTIRKISTRCKRKNIKIAKKLWEKKSKSG